MTTVGLSHVVDLSALRITNSIETGKVMWVSQGKSVSIIRIRDNKKKLFQGYWTVNEQKPNEKVKPIGLEFENKTGKIIGLVEDSKKLSYWVTMNFKEKKKIVVPNSSLSAFGKLG